MAARIPLWVKSFRNAVKKLKSLAGRKDWYDLNQPNLRELKNTGRGNCVAWSELMAEIALIENLVTIIVTIADVDEDKSGEMRHQICVIIDKDNTVWYQGNIWLHRIKKIKGLLTKKKVDTAIKIIAKKEGKMVQYKNGTKVICAIKLVNGY